MQNNSMLGTNLRVLGKLLKRDLIVFLRRYKDLAINSMSWPLCTGLVFGYIFPELGMGKDYGAHTIVSTIIILMFYICFEMAGEISTDIDGMRKIDFELMLPISPITVFVRYGLSMGMRAFLQSAPLPILSKLILYNRFSFAQFSTVKFVCMNIFVCLMFGAYATFVAAFVKSGRFFDFRIRVTDQMAFLGCFLFPWSVLYNYMPIAAYINFLNPVTHAMESARAAFFGQAGYINFWLSCGMLSIAFFVFFILAIRAFKSRLDYVH